MSTWISRRKFLCSVGVSVGAGACHRVPGAARPKDALPRRTPNVILVMTDDQGYGDLACHGNPIIQTPNLDRLRTQSIRMTDFHVSPFCTPTRAALMTGRYSARTGAYRTSSGRTMVRRDEVTMADLFASNGYVTGMFGKWHLGDNYPYRPQDRGFAHVLWHRCGGLVQISDYWGNDYFDDTYELNGTMQAFTGYCTDVWFDGALKFIEANRKRPFFAYIPTNAPHGPYLVADKYKQPYASQGIEARRAAFMGMVTNFDENLGRLVRKLDEWGLADNTILIYMTDNGSAAGAVWAGLDDLPSKGFNAGMRGKKSSPYDGGHRVPFFVRWPAGKLGPSRDVDRLAGHIDVVPTLMDLCGRKRPDGPKLDGRSMAPLLRDVDAPWPDRVFHTQIHGGAGFRVPGDPWDGSAVLTKRWRLVHGKHLYDMQADPSQSTDLATQYPAVFHRLRKTHEMWFADVSKGMRPCHIVLGGAENPMTLTSQDWYLLVENPPWSQGHVRGAKGGHGAWNVEVERAGSFEIALRRWPVELDVPITAAIKGGKAISASKARLKIGDVDQTVPIGKNDKAAMFHVALSAGKTTMQTWFLDEKGSGRGAYYAYVKRLR